MDQQKAKMRADYSAIKENRILPEPRSSQKEKVNFGGKAVSAIQSESIKEKYKGPVQNTY